MQGKLDLFIDENQLGFFFPFVRLLENGAKLQIDAAHLSDAGSYTCQMSNVAGRVNLTYQVDVFSEKLADCFLKNNTRIF